MHHDFLDRHSRDESPIHRLPAGAKMTGALLAIGAIVTLPMRIGWFFVLASVALIVIAVTSRIPARFLVRRLLFLEPFVAGVAVLSLLREGGWVVVEGIVIRSTLSLVTILLLANTTPFSTMLEVLRKIHVSPTFITILALMYRYLFVLVDEMERMRRARMSRSFTRRNRGAWNMLSTTVGELFVRSSARAERIYSAMCARGWR